LVIFEIQIYLKYTLDADFCQIQGGKNEKEQREGFTLLDKLALYFSELSFVDYYYILSRRG